MPSWLLRGLRRGVVTTGYPARPDPSAADLPTPPVFLPGRLSAALAAALVRVCPSRALSLAGDRLRYDVGACTACRRCLQVAGAAAAPSGEFELAATARSQLIKHIPIGADW
jgi:hypothetical protein